MILESPAALRLVAAMSKLGALGAPREQLIRAAGIGTTTFYRLIGSLIDNGLVKTNGSKYALNFESPYCFRFKLWQDMERLYELSREDRDMALDVAASLVRHSSECIRCLWLVGSGSRSELSAKSDLDFLLVTRGNAELLAPSIQRRQVTVIQMTDVDFRAAHGRGDSFIVSALQHGIVMSDDGFAQEFYSAPLPVALSQAAALKEESEAESYRDAVLRHVSRDEIENAQSSLRSQAVHVGRMLLRSFGELPPNRPALVRASREYFGDKWSETLGEAAISPPAEKEALVTLSRKIAEQHDLFQAHFAHLVRFAALLSADSRHLESLVAEVFRELVPDAQIEESGPARGVDIRISTPGLLYLIEVKSSRGQISRSAIKDAAEHLRRARKKTGLVGRLILVLNSQGELPPLERSLHEAKITIPSPGQAAEISVVTGLQLLRTHNRMHLEQVPPLAVLNEMLGESGLSWTQSTTLGAV